MTLFAGPDRELPFVKFMALMVEAVERHQRENPAPSKQDAALYMAVLGGLGHHRVSRKALAVYYAEEEK